MTRKSGRDIAGREDEAHVSGEAGDLILGVRADVAGSLCDTDGDRTPLQVDSSGALRISGSVSAAEEFAKDSIPGASDKGIQALAVRADTAATQVDTDGDYTPLIVDANGRLQAIAVVASGGIASGAIASGAVASGAIVDGAMVTVGVKTDAASTATDATAVSAISLLKQISKMEQAPASRAVTNAGTFAVQASVADGASVTLGAKADAKSSDTDATPISIMQVLKQISFSVQANSGNTETMDDWDDGNKCAITPTATATVTYGPDTLFDSDADNSAQVLKVSAGNLYKLDIYNSNAAIAFIQLFDVAAGSVTVGTTTPKYVITVPGQGAASIDFNVPMAFSTAITYAATTTPTGLGDPTVGLVLSAVYK